METIALETRSLSRSFGSTHAVQNVDLRVRAGSVFGLVGANGAGKSTLMKLVCGLIRRDAGSVCVLGHELGPCESSSHVGLLVEAPAVYPRLDAFENLMNRALVLGLPDPRAACREALGLVGLDEATAGDGSRVALWPRGTCARDLSTGQRQRLGVALALLGSPEVLVLDEPFSGVDPSGARVMRDTLARLSRERGVTVLVSSHTISHLERVCTDFGIMRAGRLVRTLSAAELDQASARRLTLRVVEAERAVAVLAEKLPGLSVRMLDDGALLVSRRDGGLPDQRVLGEALLAAGIAVTELSVSEPDVERELVRMIDGRPGDRVE